MFDKTVTEKEKIRNKVHKKRKLMSESEVIEKSNLIIEKLKEVDEVKKAKTIHVYLDQDNEVITEDFVKSLKNKKVYTPSEDMVHISHRKVKIVEDRIELSEDVYSDINFDVVIAPGIAFKRDGSRIGYGGGYYDKFLEKQDCFKIGLCFKSQVVRKMPVTKKDVIMDLLITD